MKRLPLPMIASFALFIALCMSLAYWGLQASRPPARAVLAAPPPPPPEVAIDSAATLFGGASVAAAASNYQLKGIVVDHRGRRSVAILSVDGKPAQALAVGAQVAPGVTVQEVFAHYVVLREGGVQKRIELPDASSVPSNSVSGAPLPATPMPAPAFTPPAQQTGAQPVFNAPQQPVMPLPTFNQPAQQQQPATNAPPAAVPGNVAPLPRPATTTVTPTPPGG